MLLGKYLQQQFGLAEDAPLLKVNELTSRLGNVPRVEVSHDDFPHWKPASEVELGKQRYRGKKVVFLTRDPRDILVSYYFQYTRRGDKELANDAAFGGTMSDFIRHRIGGIDSLLAFFNAWADQRAVPAAFLPLRYEDLHADPKATLRRLLEFLNLPKADDAMLDGVVSYCSFDNMRRIERENMLRSRRLSVTDVNDPDSFKVRKGKVAGYSEYLTPSDLEYLDSRLAELDDMYAEYKTRDTRRMER